jgi:hypothetical protein
MSINQTMSIRIGSRLRPHLMSCVLLVSGGLAWSNAIATTEGETALANTPLPHEKLGAGRESAKVHWVRLRGYFEGAKGNSAMLSDLKENVQSCIQAAQLAGRPTRPPQVWPDYVHSNQSDTYDAANRTITYATTLLYTVDHANCSLVENRRVVAKLASTNGFCEIDFVNKTARGVCDAHAHTEAPAITHRVPQAQTSGGQVAATNAQMQATLAAMDKAMKQFGPTKTGGRKTIAGIECDVLTRVLVTEGTACVSRGGSFAGWHAGPGSAGSGMELELNAVGGLNARAVKAQLDASVNAAVFAPYLDGAFQITNNTRRK